MERGPGAAERLPGGEAGRDQSGVLARSSDRPGKRKALHSGEGDACPQRVRRSAGRPCRPDSAHKACCMLVLYVGTRSCVCICSVGLARTATQVHTTNRITHTAQLKCEHHKPYAGGTCMAS